MALDVRNLERCGYCGVLGDRRRMLTNLPGKDMAGFHHGGCAVQGLLAEVLVKLPQAELMKLTLADTGGPLMQRILESNSELVSKADAPPKAPVLTSGATVSRLKGRPLTSGRVPSFAQTKALQACVDDERGAIPTSSMSLPTRKWLMFSGYLELRGVPAKPGAAEFAYITDLGRAALAAVTARVPGRRPDRTSPSPEGYSLRAALEVVRRQKKSLE